MAAVVFGLNQGGSQGWGSAQTVVPLAAGVAAAIGFVVLDVRTRAPLIEFRLLLQSNFLAANISQILAGMVELGLGFLLPYYMLLVIGVDPVIAGVALIPATVLIVLAGALAGRAFDRVGGRGPLVVGYVLFATSGLALGVAAGAESALALVPGLALQGLGLGIVLTVNDPTGLTAVSEDDQGQAAGMINTSEQFGGVLGIAILSAVELGVYRDRLFSGLADKGIRPTPSQGPPGHGVHLPGRAARAQARGGGRPRLARHPGGTRRSRPGPRQRLRGGLLRVRGLLAGRRDPYVRPRAPRGADHHRTGLRPPVALGQCPRRVVAPA